MTKKPQTQEEINDFIEFYNGFDSNAIAVTNIMAKYSVANKTAYNWVEKFIKNLHSNKEPTKASTLHEFVLKYMYGMKERSDDYRIADISLENIDEGILFVGVFPTRSTCSGTAPM